MNGMGRLDVRGELPPLLLGTGLVMLAVATAERYGASVGLLSVVAVALFAASTACFLALPHVAVAVTIPLFAALPAMKVLVTYEVGPLKEALTLSAAVATALHLLQGEGRRALERTDRIVLTAIAAYVFLYVLNAGGLYSASWHADQWIHGLRLAVEPLILLLAGLLLPRPRRTLRWAVPALVATGCVVALYGIVQQVVGAPQLVDLGYTYDQQLRTIDGRLRSFGTLDDAFSYAALLLLVLATIIFAMRRSVISVASGVLVGIGIAVSSVLTAGVVVCALVALWLVRVGRVAAGILLAGAVVCAGVVLVIGAASPTRSQTVEAAPNTYLTLNGRTSVWASTFADRTKVPLGLGVGEVGRAAIRSQIGVTDISGSPSESEEGQLAVDSGYYATIADVGLVGLGVLMLLMIRLVVLARRGTRLQSDTAGWLCLAYLVVFALDAATRDSFTGYPNAYLGLLLVGVTLAVIREEGPAHQRAASQ